MNITIFCASSTKVPTKYFNVAKEVTRHLVDNGHRIIYGAGSVGLMGAVADECLSLKGHITGIIPEFMVKMEWANPHISELITVDSMFERKRLLIEKADAIITLPGGLGTLDELFEAITLKQLGQHSCPIIIYNPDDFFAPVNDMLHKLLEEQFIKPSHQDLYTFVNSIDILDRELNNPMLSKAVDTKDAQV